MFKRLSCVGYLLLFYKVITISKKQCMQLIEVSSQHSKYCSSWSLDRLFQLRISMAEFENVHYAREIETSIPPSTNCTELEFLCQALITVTHLQSLLSAGHTALINRKRFPGHKLCASFVLSLLFSFWVLLSGWCYTSLVSGTTWLPGCLATWSEWSSRRGWKQ